MCFIKFICMLLVVIGALNWGLVGFFQYDLVADIFKGSTTGWARTVYSLIGIAGIFSISFLFNKHLYHKSTCKPCDKE